MQELEATTDFTFQLYNSIQLLDKILNANRISPDLAKLRIKAKFKQEKTWQLKDSLLLRYRKLYVPDNMLIDEMLLRAAIIREAHDQPLLGHPGQTKLRHLLQQRYYQPDQKKDINQYRANCYTCRRLHVFKDKKLGFLHLLLVLN